MTANYGRPAFHGSFWKGEPRQVAKEEKKSRIAALDRAGKTAVRARDKGICRVCGRKATEVHEALDFKSLGGVACLENSIQVCAEPKGKCHALLQQHGIRVIGEHCSKPLIFEMSKAVAYLVFRNRVPPAHVRVIAK
jgi:hypothetical protein